VFVDEQSWSFATVHSFVQHFFSHSTSQAFSSELQLPAIMQLIGADLSEPYSIYTYRYFIHAWPELSFLVSHSFHFRAGPVLVAVDAALLLSSPATVLLIRYLRLGMICD
jgi:hypothetical protein